MERIQLHKFVDLATPVKQPKESKGNEPSRFPRNGNRSCSGRCDGPPSFRTQLHRPVRS